MGLCFYCDIMMVGSEIEMGPSCLGSTVQAAGVGLMMSGIFSGYTLVHHQLITILMEQPNWLFLLSSQQICNNCVTDDDDIHQNLWELFQHLVQTMLLKQFWRQKLGQPSTSTSNKLTSNSVKFRH